MIDTIFFDVGNTLRIVVKDQDFIREAKNEMMKLTQTTEPEDQFFEKLEKRWKVYRKYEKEVRLDISEMELWSQHMLPDYDPELICANATRLTRLWRDHDGRRVPRPDVKDTIIELNRRGYTLGIIANTITETEIPDWMCTDKVAHYFKTVILSSKVRLRKPDKEIYELACRAIGKAPENCAYVGDNPVRDVEGTRAAGFSKMILINEPDTISKEPPEQWLPVDHEITKISDLLELFPALN